jgi:hypothetical protein
MFNDDERSLLQLDDNLIDLIDRWHNGERDCHPPLGRWRLKVCMGVHMLNDLALTQDVELERAIEVCPPIHLLWAHLIVHIHDELFFVTHVHTPLVNDFDPLPILKQGSHVFYDNVNLMQHGPNAHREFGGLFEANQDATMASDHCVLAINQYGHKLGMPDCRRTTQHIQEVGYQVENVFNSVSFKHWDGNQVQIG